MSWFEWCLVILALIAAGMGGHAVGFGRGKSIANIATRMGMHKAWYEGWLEGQSSSLNRGQINNPYSVTPHQAKLIKEMKK